MTYKIFSHYSVTRINFFCLAKSVLFFAWLSSLNYTLRTSFSAILKQYRSEFSQANKPIKTCPNYAGHFPARAFLQIAVSEKIVNRPGNSTKVFVLSICVWGKQWFAIILCHWLVKSTQPYAVLIDALNSAEFVHYWIMVENIRQWHVKIISYELFSIRGGGVSCSMHTTTHKREFFHHFL